MFGIMKYLRISLIFSFLISEALSLPQGYASPLGVISRVDLNGQREVLQSLGNAPVAVYRKQEYPVRVVPYFVPRVVYQSKPKPYPKPYPKGQKSGVSGRNNAAVKNNNSLLGLDLGGLLGGVLGGVGGGSGGVLGGGGGGGGLLGR